MANLRQDGNDSLLELFQNNDMKLLDFIFDNSYFMCREKMEEYRTVNNYVRNGQSNKLYCLYKSKYQLIRQTKHLKKRLVSFSKDDNLFFLDGEKYIAVKIDSTGNAAPRKFIQELLKQNLNNRNYKISHLEKKPNTPEKHGFKNIIIIPTFLDHFIDSNIILNSINVNNIAKLIAVKLYGLEEGFFKNFIPTKTEREYSEKVKYNLLC